MPTGYTNQLIQDKLDFAGFTWACARAFGALVMMRDDASDAPIPLEFEPSEYSRNHLAESKQAIADWDAMSPEQKRAWAEAKIDEDIRYHKKKEKEAKAVHETYKAMLAEVQEWSPPSEDHVGLRKFMIEQLEESIRFDGDGQYHRDSIAKIGTVNVYVSARTEELHRSVAYAEKSYREECERVEGRNRWMKQLRESVGNPPSFVATV